MVELTEQEAALYDRQIRLWGLDAQRRITSAKVLLINLSGLNAEVCKNLVLGGIGSVTLHDEKDVQSSDLASQFFLTDADIGKNRAEASQARVSALNPLVRVQTDTEPLSAKPDSFFTGFTIVVASNLEKVELKRIDGICHAANVAFIGAEALGLGGYVFVDFGKHEYIDEKAVSSASKDKDDPTLVPIVSKESVTFPTLESSFAVSWNKYPRRCNKILPAVQVLLDFRDQHQRHPVISAEEDLKELMRIKDKLCGSNGVDAGFVPDDVMRLLATGSGTELNPVCAILGGFIAQEVVKSISHKDLPVNNFFLYHGLEGSGTVEKIGE